METVILIKGQAIPLEAAKGLASGLNLLVTTTQDPTREPRGIEVLWEILDGLDRPTDETLPIAQELNLVLANSNQYLPYAKPFAAALLGGGILLLLENVITNWQEVSDHFPRSAVEHFREYPPVYLADEDGDSD